MHSNALEQAIETAVETDSGNTFEGWKIFDEPIFAYGSPDDPMYAGFKNNPEANLRYLILPHEWLPEAKTVISIFLPFSEKVRSSNRGGECASLEWAVGRIEGAAFIKELAKVAVKTLNDGGEKAVSPMIDQRMQTIELPGSNPYFAEGTAYTSTWSERHNGFICGMGTFSLSKALITEKGVAGRMFSVITSKKFPYTERDYKGLYDNCIKCYACVKNCPVGAIDKINGKSHPPCKQHLLDSKEKLGTRYGCGKCQVKTPCESSNPRRH
jgi:epoxyqueuosine reductase